jgi:hypothetical protein
MRELLFKLLAAIAGYIVGIAFTVIVMGSVALTASFLQSHLQILGSGYDTFTAWIAAFVGVVLALSALGSTIISK